jgi:hypothetical protein
MDGFAGTVIRFQFFFSSSNAGGFGAAREVRRGLSQLGGAALFRYQLRVAKYGTNPPRERSKSRWKCGV